MQIKEKEAIHIVDSLPFFDPSAVKSKDQMTKSQKIQEFKTSRVDYCERKAEAEP
jgi:hypothetical protein